MHGAGDEARKALAKAVELVQKMSRWPAGSPQSKGGQFAPKQTAGGHASKFNEKFLGKPAGGGQKIVAPQLGKPANTFVESGWQGSGMWEKPKGPPPGSVPHPKKGDKGETVHIHKPTFASPSSTWSNANRTATFTPDGKVPAVLNNVEFKSWTPPKDGWSKVSGTNEKLDQDHPFEPHPQKKTAAGVLIVEPDGRLWLTKPTNEFGGYVNTYPKGTAESGLTLQQNAIKEAWEETGLKIKIVGILGDYERDTSKARMYVARRVGGTPKDMGWESQAIRLTPTNLARDLLNRSHDKGILDDLEREYFGKAKGLPTKAESTGKPGHWQFQERWPGGSSLGGQWKAMGADGITAPPKIAGGIDSSNAIYQKTANLMHSLARTGDIHALNATLDKYGGAADKFASGQKPSSHVKWGAQVHQYVTQLKADIKAKISAVASADKVRGPDKLGDYTYTGGKPGGSNPGGMYQQGAEQFLVKGNKQLETGTVTQKVSDDRARNEVLAAKLMQAAGAGAPDMKLIDLQGKYGGGLGVASKWEGSSVAFHPGMGAHRDAIQKDFAIHAWLANYDVLGMGYDNVKIRADGKASNIDPGGALLFRAQGLPKGAEHGVKGGVLDPSAPEFESMRKTTAEQKAVFGSMTASQLADSAARLANISDEQITKLVKTYGPGDEKARDALAANLIARKAAILAKASALVPAQDKTQQDESLESAGKKIVQNVKAETYKVMPPMLSKDAGEQHKMLAAAIKTAAEKGDLGALGLAAATAKQNLNAAKASGIQKEIDQAAEVWVYATDHIANVKASRQKTTAPPEPAQDKAQQVAQQVQSLERAGNKIVAEVKPSAKPAQEPKLSDATPAHIANTVGVIKAAIEAKSLAVLGVAAATMEKIYGEATNYGDLSFVVSVASGMVKNYAQEGIANVKAAIEEKAAQIADAAPKVEVHQPSFQGDSAAYYDKVKGKLDAAFKAGDIAAFKAASKKPNGTGAWPLGSINGKEMQKFFDTALKELEQQQAAKVVATAQTAAQAVQKPVDNPPAPGKATGSNAAMPVWKSHLLPDSNSNASSHNAKVNAIAALADKGDAQGILSLNFGTNTYGKKQAKLANDALAALGSPFLVSAGQKANAHPALTGGVPAATVAAAAKTTGQPNPAAAPAAKPAPAFKPEQLTTPPDFQNFSAPGKPLSSVASVNDANNYAVQLVYDTAKKGDLQALKNLSFELLDKSTGAKTGVFKSLAEHPSQHVKAYWANLIDQIDLQLNPPRLPRLGKVVSGSSLADAAAKLKPVPHGKAIAAIPKNQKAGLYIINGQIDPEVVNEAVKQMSTTGNTTVDSAPWKNAAKAAYNNASSVAQASFSTYVTTSGAAALNTALRNGNDTSYGGKKISQYVKDFEGLLVDIPEGTTFVRNMGGKGYGQKPPPKDEIVKLQQFLLNAPKGTVLQEPGFSSSSYTNAQSILSGNDIQWQFTAGPGVKAFPAWLTANTGEGESLFPPNTQYVIRGAKKVGKTVVVDAILLPRPQSS